MIHRPGQIALTSGQYAVVNSQGLSLGYEVTVVKGEPFPPTQFPGLGFTLVDPTRHRM